MIFFLFTILTEIALHIQYIVITFLHLFLKYITKYITLK